MSIARVASSATVAMPSWVSVVRGAPSPRIVRTGCSRPFSAVAPLYGGPTPVDAGQDAGGGVFPAYGAPPTPA